ncbi:MAG: hypothetical protein M1835_005020 [Candelina submexicana]|nr:MAG: hypothetical protein M1835_005020 [Candelina submexicana]
MPHLSKCQFALQQSIHMCIVVAIYLHPDGHVKRDDSVSAHIEFHQPTSDALTSQILIRAIKAEVSLLFGDYGIGVISGSLAGIVTPSLTNKFSSIMLCLDSHPVTRFALTHRRPKVKYLSPATSTAIIRVSRAHYRLVWAAMSFITALPPEKKPCVIQVVRVSGTIKKAEQEAIRRARASIMSARRAAGDTGENELDKYLARVEEGDAEKAEAMEGIEDEDGDDDDDEDEGEGAQDGNEDGVG